MKLLYITNGITGIGGLERVLSVKLSYFAETLGHEVHVITLNEQNRDSFYQFSSLIKVHNVKTRKGRLAYLKSYIDGVNEVAERISPDIISVCDDGVKGLYVPLWIRKGHAAMIYERHASMLLNHSRLQSCLIKLGGMLYDRVVVLTKYNTSEWISRNIEVIPNPLSFPIDEKSAQINKQIICVGSLSYHKGYDMLIKAWASISDLFPDWYISIYGRGNPAVYEPLMKEHHVEESVRFCGPTNDIKKEMLKSSFLVLSSRSEGFGMVLIEAMACGLPCVAFDCPCGPRDIVQNGKNGILVPPENVKALAEGMRQMIEDENQRYAMSERAMESASQYKIEYIAAIWESLFNRLHRID